MAYQQDAATDFEAERLAPGQYADFRCERCLDRFPFSQLVVHDGHKLNRACAFREAPSERELLATEAYSDAADLYAQTVQRTADLQSKASNWSLMDGVSAISRIAGGGLVYPQPIPLHPGGASVSLLLTGVAFSPADVLTYSVAGLSNSVPVISTNQTLMAFNVSASGLTPPGDYDFLFNGNRFPKAFQVRL